MSTTIQTQIRVVREDMMREVQESWPDLDPAVRSQLAKSAANLVNDFFREVLAAVQANEAPPAYLSESFDDRLHRLRKAFARLGHKQLPAKG